MKRETSFGREKKGNRGEKRERRRGRRQCHPLAHHLTATIYDIFFSGNTVGRDEPLTIRSSSMQPPSPFYVLVSSPFFLSDEHHVDDHGKEMTPRGRDDKNHHRAVVHAPPCHRTIVQPRVCDFLP
ncbi:hypothetical protein U1Q18_036643 [Sarracenia purpurea var. burkii]